MGRPLTLGDLDSKVQQYIRALRQAGAPVGTSVIIAAAKGIIMSVDRTMQVENAWRAHSADQDMGSIIDALYGAGKKKS